MSGSQSSKVGGNPVRALSIAALALGALAGCGGALRQDLYAAAPQPGCAAIPEPEPTEAVSDPAAAAHARAAAVRVPAARTAATAALEALTLASPEVALVCALQQVRQAPEDAPVRASAAPARLAALLAERLPPGADRDKVAAEGVRMGEAALVLGADPGPTHYWTAVSLGLAIAEHPTVALARLDALKAHLDAAVAAAPGVAEGGPLRVLGRLYLEAPAWPQGFGDADKGLELLRKADAGWPEHPQNPWFLALAVSEVEGDAAAAVALFDRALALLDAARLGPLADRWRVEIQAARTAAR
jgi:hypothetical protein